MTSYYHLLLSSLRPIISSLTINHILLSSLTIISYYQSHLPVPVVVELEDNPMKARWDLADSLLLLAMLLALTIGTIYFIYTKLLNPVSLP
jgi:hypothetical protein